MPCRIVFVGEGMLELSTWPDAGWQLGHGGDTLNTAIHMARMGCDVAFLTALGADPFSQQMRSGWEAEGLDLSMVLTDPDRSSGLYAISCDDAGERSFSYWRGESAARTMFSLPDVAPILERVAEADLLVFSLISLAILTDVGQDRLIQLATAVRRNGGKVAFDGNYRPRIWPDAAIALAARDRALAVCDIGLPTLEDERLLTPDATSRSVQAHWARLGCDEIIVKLGAEGCLMSDGSIIPPEQLLSPIDTSGAGDAFNAGYLFARLGGSSPAGAARTGHRLAGWTIMRPGAIPSLDDRAPYDNLRDPVVIQ